MDWSLIWIGIAVAAFVGLLLCATWAVARDIGWNKGFMDGFEDGERYGREEEKQVQLANPFHKQNLRANRSAMPRPDSAGPIRVHQAKIRGDYMLPQNQPGFPNPTKFNINPADPD